MSIDYKGRVINFMTKEQYDATEKVDNEMYAVEMPMLIDKGRSSDGSIWYRKWSDGWLEQGGTISGLTAQSNSTIYHTTVNFIKPMANTNYTIVLGKAGGGTNSSTSRTFVHTKNVNSFYVEYQNIVYTECDFYACGEGATE